MNTIKSQWEESATTLAKVFIVAVLGAWSASGFDVGAVLGNWRSYLGAGIAAVAAFVYSWLDRRDDRYGLTDTDM